MNHKLIEWIASDDACEATSVTIHSGHDPAYDKDLVIKRVKSLIATGVTVRCITLTICEDVAHSTKVYQRGISQDRIYDSTFDDVIEDIYRTSGGIESMTIELDPRNQSLELAKNRRS